MTSDERTAAARLQAIRDGGKAALARALADIERAGDHDDTVALLDAAHGEPGGHIVGVTGPPGVGKSSMLSAMIRQLRGRGRSVGVIAVDPSSKRSKGALLGDRTRIATDPEDQQIFIRSMAARDRLGGLAEITIDAAVLMRALFDVVLVETVGVGQSETDVAMLADTVLFCVQPASGDSLQFMKAGIMEIPDLAVVTKADLGAAAERTRIDVVSALKAAGRVHEGWKVRVLSVASSRGEGIDALLDAIDDHAQHLADSGRLNARRRERAQEWLIEAVRERFGREGLARARPLLTLGEGESPFRKVAAISRRLAERLGPDPLDAC